MATATRQTYEEAVATVAGGQLSYRHGGAGDPVVVLHHEIGSPGWLAFYEEIGESRTVYVPDLPGYGQSERPDWARSPRDLAAIVNLFLDSIAVEHCALVGLGFGGWLAAEIATMNQQRLSHLVLVNPLGIRPERAELMDQFLMSHEDYVRAGFADESAFAHQFGAEPSVDQLETWDIHREMTTRIAWRPHMHNPALVHLLPEVRVPALVVAGEGDRIVPRECCERYASALAAGRLATMPGGHFLEMERAGELASLVSTFLGTGGN